MKTTFSFISTYENASCVLAGFDAVLRTLSLDRLGTVSLSNGSRLALSKNA